MRIGPDVSNGCHGSGLVFRVGICVGKQDRHGFTSLRTQLPGGVANRAQIDRGANAAIRERAFRDLEAVASVDNGFKVTA